jgi:hypothetical protein
VRGNSWGYGTASEAPQCINNYIITLADTATHFLACESLFFCSVASVTSHSFTRAHQNKISGDYTPRLEPVWDEGEVDVSFGCRAGPWARRGCEEAYKLDSHHTQTKNA